jgi:uncharacterized membrane protein YiaA
LDKPKLPKPWIAIRDHVGLVFVAVALGLCLRVVGVPWWPVLAWFAVSGAVIYVIGAGRGKRFLREEESRGLVSRLLQMYGDAPEAETVKAELEEARLESKRLGRDVSQQLIGVALLVASAFGMALAVHGGAAPLREPNQMTVRFSGGTEEHPVVDPQKQPPSGPNETILRLDPGLERDISAYFRMPRSEGGSGLSSRGLFFVVALLILAEVIVLGWALKHRPSAVPLIGAADLAALVIKNADHLSRPGGGWFWGTVYIFLGIALFLLVAGVRQVLVPKAPAASTPGPIGKISKQGSSFLRFLLVEAGQTAARIDPQLKRFYRRLAVRRNRSIAKVAVARKLATRLYLMLREDWTYAQLSQAVMQVSPSHSVAGE